MAGREAATITESMATTTEIRQSMNIVTLNLKGFFGVSTGLSFSPSFLSSWGFADWDGSLILSWVPSSLHVSHPRLKNSQIGWSPFVGFCFIQVRLPSIPPKIEFNVRASSYTVQKALRIKPPQ
jgi:hypothetical protein